MDMELDPRVKPLPYKVKATSRESAAGKGGNILDPDLRTHWSTGTNTKEWILLELDEACLLSNVRIYNKSVLEWEITVGLRYKPEAFVKVRPRCEAPKRDMSYSTNYTPCRYVRLSCLRGNPIAVYFIQLIGVTVKGLEPELQPVINYLLPHILSHKQDAHDMHLQLLENIASRLLVFLPQLETELSTFTDASDSNIRFLAMLVGPFYPILQIVNEREAVKGSAVCPDSEMSRNNQSSIITVSSNFEVQPRRSRNQSLFMQSCSCPLAFGSDAAILLLRKASKDLPLGIVCRAAARSLHKIIGPIIPLAHPIHITESALSSMSDETTASAMPTHADITDYSVLFGKEFEVANESWNANLVNVLDIASVEEGILHVLYACASHPLLCNRLAESNLDFWSILPLIQALLPALRPHIICLDRVDESFGQWKHPSVEQALSQIVILSSSPIYHPLLHACAGYLASYSSSHAKSACVLVDLCTGLFSPWISTVTAKVDLAIELMEDLLGIIQVSHQSITRVRIALKCILLGLSGQIDDVLAKYKEHKRKLLFLIEMLEPFLDPVIFSVNNTTPFGGASPISLEKQENNCFFALNIIREAVRRPTILPSLESEWRRGSVASSVILSILGPNMPLPSDIDLFKCSTAKVAEPGISISSNASVSKLSTSSDVDGKIDGINNAIKFDVLEEAGLLFAPQELKNTLFTNFTDHCMGDIPGRCCEPTNGGNEDKNKTTWISMNHFQLDSSLFSDYFNLKLNYLKLTNLHECELRAAAFQQLALGLSSQCDISAEGYDAAVDAFILAAECFINPFFMISFTPNSKLSKQLKLIKSMINQSSSIMELKKDFLKTVAELEIISYLERKRDKIVLEILIQAAKVNKESRLGHSKSCSGDIEHSKQSISTLPHDTKDIDAVTLLRLNQNLLFEFVIQQLQREHHLSHEVLLQALLFLLQSATELLCPPEFIIDIILLSAESLSMLLMSQYNKHGKGVTQFDLEKLHGLQRFWLLLERIVEASSGSDVKSGRASYGIQCHSLIPLSSWINKISKFSNASPIARFLGWMAVSRYAEQYHKERLFFASDLSQLTLLLTIFADELIFVDDSLQLKVEEETSFKQADTFAQLERESTHSHASDQDDSFYILYPSMHKFFPNMRRKFRTFGETILEAIGLQLKCLPSNAIPEILRWFSDLCMCPYAEAMKIRDLASLSSFDCLKGYSATNAKVIVLYILESLVTVHIESMLPEMARVAQILISLCKTSYCDVAFMESVLDLLKPFISFFLKKAALNEKLLAVALPCEDFELNFDALFDSIKNKRELQNRSGVNRFQGSLMIFILGDLFLDLSLKRKIDILESLCLWTGFTSSELTSSFPNYLCAFKKIFDSCEMLLEGQLKSFGFVIPCKEQEVMVSLIDKTELSHDSSGYGDQRHTTKPAKDFISSESFIDVQDRELYLFSIEEMKECSEVLERLILKLIPEIEKCWKLHSKFVNELTLKIAQCFLFSRCLKYIGLSGSVISSSNDGTTPYASPRDLSYIWDNGLQDLAKTLVEFQENECWHTTSVMLDYLFSLPQSISLDSCISNICSLIKQFCVCAPMISWRLQTDKWLTYLFMRGIGNVDVLKNSLIDLLGTMLSHGEPEQRAVALHHLGVMVGLDTYDRAAMLSLTFHSNVGGSEPATLLSEEVILTLVSNTWDRVASLILSEPSIMLRSHAMALLSSYVPFVTRSQLQSFLVSSSNILQGFERFSPILEGHLTRLSLGLLASACLYSPSEDITLIPEGIWKTLEHMGTSRTGWLDDVEKSVCLALCKLQTEFVDGKEALKEALIQTSTTKSSDYNFKNIRESILQVLPCLTSTRAYFEFFSKKADKESQELEEAEIEIELLQKEKAMQEVLGGSKNLLNHKDDNRIQQIKDNIRFLERSKLKEEVAERMLKKHAMRRNRKKILDEIALQEMKLLEELDRDRKNEQEQEIERQRQLELERARTRELQFNLDMERERQSQRELQRELELVESGVRSSRREFSSNSSSRPREKFREREAGRSGLEGSLRPAGIKGQENCNAIQTSNCSLSLSPTVVLSGSRPFLGQPPTILQSKERPAERGSISYEDSLEGSRDSGDANSAGDPELSLAFDGPSGGFGSTSRRGSKSRQVVERRDREARREGKWERKHA